MFDDFRQQADDADYEDQPLESEAPAPVETVRPMRASAPLPVLSRPKRILGMTGPQRFVIAVMLMLQVCLLGTLFLLVTQRIVPPLLN